MPIVSASAACAGRVSSTTTVTRSDVPLSARVTRRRSAYGGASRPASWAGSVRSAVARNGATDGSDPAARVSLPLPEPDPDPPVPVPVPLPGDDVPVGRPDGPVPSGVL